MALRYGDVNVIVNIWQSESDSMKFKRIYWGDRSNSWEMDEVEGEDVKEALAKGEGEEEWADVEMFMIEQRSGNDKLYVFGDESMGRFITLIEI
jgi:hypothetical protein